MGQYIADTDNEIHHIEIEAYAAVLKAFIAQSEDLSWAKEGVITELRKELRLSDAEHREILGKVHLDDTIKSIRERRNIVTGQQLEAMNPCLSYPSLVSHECNKRKKHATPLPSLMYPCQPSSLPMPVSTSSSPKYIKSTKPSSAPARMHFSSSKHMPQAQPSPIPVAIPLSSSKHLSHAQPKAVAMPSPLTVQSRDSSDTTIMEQHMHSQPPMVDPLSQGKQITRCSKVRVPGKKQVPKKGQVNSGSETIKVASDIITIPDTDKLIAEVEKICGAQPNDSQLMRAKLALREHERALMEAIRKIAAISDDGVQNGNKQCEEARQMDTQGFYYGPNYNINFKLKRTRKAGKSCAVLQDDAFPKICYEPIV